MNKTGSSNATKLIEQRVKKLAVENSSFSVSGYSRLVLTIIIDEFPAQIKAKVQATVTKEILDYATYSSSMLPVIGAVGSAKKRSNVDKIEKVPGYP